jgi:Na+/proline symporter
MLGSAIPVVDWVVIAVYTCATVFLGLLFARRGGRSIEQFFVSGRSLPWWLAGTSIVATTFACDTPLYVTDLVRRFGIQGSCFEWAGSWGLVITIFITGRLLRRSGLLTDVQLSEFRYGGRPGAILRVFQAGYYALLFNTIVLGWVLAAMSFWAEEVLGMNRYIAVISSAVLALSYASFSGLWGVVATDLFQFVVATSGAIALAILSVKHVGGIGAMVGQLRNLSGWEGRSLNIWPHPTPSMGLTLIGAYFGLQWVVAANPLLYTAQRMLACRSDRDTSLAVLWNVIARYLLNTWPWVTVALCSPPCMTTRWPTPGWSRPCCRQDYVGS